MSKHLDDMVGKAKSALNSAYVPYSHFPVAACLRTSQDHFFVGCNVENAAYGLTLCAEAVAIGAMVANDERIIVEVVILVPARRLCPPCGSCLQQISEFADATTPVHLYNTTGKHKTYTLQLLLPVAFGSQNMECE